LEILMFSSVTPGILPKSRHIPSNSSLTTVAFHVTQSEVMTALFNKRNLCSAANREGYKRLQQQTKTKMGQNRNRTVPRWSWVTSAVRNNKRNEKANDSTCLSALWRIKRTVGENGKFQSSSHWKVTWAGASKTEVEWMLYPFTGYIPMSITLKYFMCHFIHRPSQRIWKNGLTN
jgi:hypothetical protein